MAKVGRPTKLDPDVAKRILMALALGNYVETAAAFAGVAKVTVYEWLKRGRAEEARLAASARARPKPEEQPFLEFANAVEKAMADSEIAAVKKIAMAANDNWQAAAWHLERKFPDRWGRKDMVNVKVQQEIDKFLDMLEARLPGHLYEEVLRAVDGSRAADGAEEASP